MRIADIQLPYDIFLFLITIICVLILKKEKFILSLPITINSFFISYYNFIDDILLERKHILSPFGGTYNYDYRRLIISFIMVLIMLFLSIFLSKKIESKKAKIIYIISTFLFNILLAYITYNFHRHFWIS